MSFILRTGRKQFFRYLLILPFANETITSHAAINTCSANKVARRLSYRARKGTRLDHEFSAIRRGLHTRDRESLYFSNVTASVRYRFRKLNAVCRNVTFPIIIKIFATIFANYRRLCRKLRRLRANSVDIRRRAVKPKHLRR